MQALRSLLKYPILRSGIRREYCQAFKPANMDELPVPYGPWLEHHNKKQAKYNVHLVAGIISLLISVLFCGFSGLVNFNYGPPPLDDDSHVDPKC